MRKKGLLMGLQHRVVFGYNNLMILVLRRNRREGKEGLVEYMRLGAFWGLDVCLWRRGGGIIETIYFEKIKKRVITVCNPRTPYLVPRNLKKR